MTLASTTAKGRYQQLSADRQPFLDRGRDCAKVTVPTLLLPEGHTAASDIYVPYQSLGARGINNLSNKLLLTLFPPNSPFFRYEVDDVTLTKLEQEHGSALRGQIDLGLAKVERAVQDFIEAGGYRAKFFEAFKHLLVAGNALCYMLPEGGMRVFKLNEYVVKRDPAGNLLELITHEQTSISALPENYQALVPAENVANPDKPVSLYTWLRRDGSKWQVHQEVEDKRAPESEGSFPLDKSPYLVLRWTAIDGESYGRSYVEEYIGDMYTLEGLSQAILEGTAAAARVVILVKPGSPTSTRKIAEARSGAVITGDGDDVSVLQLDKYADFKTAETMIEKISQRLSYSFLLNAAVQRDAERVTAEEIRFVAQELEDNLGGAYSVQAQEIQLPFLNRIVFDMQRKNKLPQFPKGVLKPTLVTGLEALGRGHDLTKLQTAFAVANGIFANQVVMQYADGIEVLRRVFAAAGVNADGIVKTPEQIAQEQQQAQQMQMVGALGPQAINALGGVAKEAAKGGGSDLSAPEE